MAPGQPNTPDKARIPPIDLVASYASLKPEIDAAVTRVMASGQYIGGPEVEGLEREFALFCGAPMAVAVASGTDALRFSLAACGVGPGDEVVTTPFTFIATTEAISQVGARPVFVDVEPRTCNLDPARLEAAVGPRTRAIVPVHLYGQPADMDPILDIAKRRRLVVVEDACQAHGAQYRGRGAGTMADAGAFSFYPTKNIGAFGEAGMVVTARADVAQRVGRLRDHGQSGKYIHAEEGYNGRLDALQAAVLRVKLKRLPAWNERRRAIAALYRRGLEGVAEPPVVAGPERGGSGAGRAGASATLTLPVEMPWARHVYHLYPLRIAGRAGAPGSSERDRVREALAASGVVTGVHYPVPLHRQPCYAGLGLGEGSFPEAERAAREVLTLPLYPEMADAQVERVIRAVRQALGHA